MKVFEIKTKENERNGSKKSLQMKEILV